MVDAIANALAYTLIDGRSLKLAKTASYITNRDGKKLTLNYNTFISQNQSIYKQTVFSINIAWSLTRLKSVFGSLHKDYAANPREFITGSKNWNGIFFPSSYDRGNFVNSYSPDGEFAIHMQIGS